MNRDEILAAAREKGIKNQEYENHTLIKSGNIATAIGMIIGAILFLVELFVDKNINMALATVIFSIAATQSIYEGIKLHKKICLIVGCFIAVLAMLSLLLFVGLMVMA